MCLATTIKTIQEFSALSVDRLEAYFLFEVTSKRFHFVSKEILYILERKTSPDCKNNGKPNGLPTFFDSLVQDLSTQLSDVDVETHETYIQFNYISNLTKTNNKQIVGNGILLNIEGRLFIRGSIRVLFEAIEYQSLKVYQLDLKGKHQPIFEKKYNSSISAIFSVREKQVIKLISKDMSSKEIASELCLSLNTVHTHRRNIVKKTGLHSCQQVLEKYSNLGV